MGEGDVQNVEARIIDDTGANASSGRPGKVSGPPVKPKRMALSMFCAGVLFVALGIVFLLWPDMALETVALVLGLAFLIGGLGSIVDFLLFGAFRVFSGLLLASGVAELLVGVVFLLRPLASVEALSTIIAIGVVMAGVFQMISALRLRGRGGRFWIVETATGVVTLVLGILTVTNPSAIVWWVCIFAVTWGLALMALAFRAVRHIALHK